MGSSIPLYELSWRELATEGMRTKRHGDFSIRIEREPAMSLFGALEAAPGFFGVKLERSKWYSVTSEASAVGESDY